MSRWPLALLMACGALLRADPPQAPAPTPNQPGMQAPTPNQPGMAPTPNQPGMQAPKPNQPGLQQRPKSPAGKEEIPPEEDKGLSVEDFSFNPLEAQKWVEIGNQYLKKGKLRAAEGRYKGATKWNEGYGEAWLRLGEVEEKLKDPEAAREAYNKYLEVAPDARNSAQVRKKLEKLK